jgi:hypothetical protein
MSVFHASLLRDSVVPAALILVVAAWPLRAEEPPYASGVVRLPTFMVTDSRILPEPESWRYTRIPNFEVLSNASDRETQRLLRDFETFRLAVSLVWPVPNQTFAPCLLIVCGRDNKFAEFQPREDERPDEGTVSLFLSDPEQPVIVIDLQTQTLNLLSPSFSSAQAGGAAAFEVDSYRQLYREYVHYLLSRIKPRPPAWCEEGLAQIIMAMKFDRHSITFGKVEDPRTVSALAAGQARNAAAAGEAVGAPDFSTATLADRDFNAVLAHRALIPLDQFFGVSHDSPEARNPLGNNRWAKQAYAFVHLCLYGHRGRYQKAFVTFLTRASREPVTEAMFKECFRLTYREMLLDLRGYIQFTDHQYQEFRLKGAGLPEPPPLVLRDAADAEVGRIKGEALRLAGHIEAGRNTLIASYQRGVRDPQLLAELGLSELATGRANRARLFLEAAAQGRVVRPRAYLELARLRLVAARAGPEGAGGRLSPGQLAAVLAPLFTARTQPPPLPETYELIAEAWAQSTAAPTRDNLAVLLEGAHLFPLHSGLIYAAAQLHAQQGFNREATALVELGLKTAPDGATRQRFTTLQAALTAGR